ncbi:MAG: hypothetical protein ABI947_15780, partial [Chloroflexota bacterium]
MTDLPTQSPTPDQSSARETEPMVRAVNNLQDHQDRPDTQAGKQADNQTSTEPVYRIPVTPPPMKRSDFGPKVDEIVRDYEQKYGTFRDEESPKVKESTRSFYAKMKPKYIPAPRT